MLKNLLLVTQILVLHICVAQRLIYDEKIPVEKLRVVLEQTQGGKVSDMLTDLEYIPLNADKGGVIDYVLDMQILGDRIGIVSKAGGHFYLYNLDGSLVKKIDKIDGVKSSGANRLFFFIRKKDDTFLLNHGALQVRIDMQGNIVDTLTLKISDFKREDGQYVDGQVSLGTNNNYKAFRLDLNSNKRLSHDLLSLNDSVLIRFDPVDTLDVMFANSEFSKPYNEKVFFTGGYNTKIFELDTVGINKIYELILPLRNIFDYKPLIKLKNSNWKEIENYFGEQMDRVYGLSKILFYNGYLIFKANRYDNPMWIAYHLETKEVYGLDNIIADASNDYLAFFDSDEIFAEGDYLYSMIYPSHITQAKNKSQEEGHKMRKAYEDLAKHNNPILVRFKLKLPISSN